METVALEWVSSQEVEPRHVVQFVQQLSNVPEEAACEVGDIFSRRCRVGVGNDDRRRIRNEVHLSCEPRVAAFLCKKFGKQTQHVTGGEIIRVRCKRVYPGAKPLGKLVATSIKGHARGSSGREEQQTDEPTCEATLQQAGDKTPTPALPMDKVIALIDLLGDQVVEAQEAYELFADADAPPPRRMTMLGLTKALAKLSKNEWTARPTSVKITVESLRYLLTKLIASNNVAVRRIPSATTVPFLSYTDFLACYVAFLASLHSST